MRRVVHASLIAALLMSTGCSWIKERRFISDVMGKPAMDFELQSLTGETERLSDYRGKPVLLAFWAYG